MRRNREMYREPKQQNIIANCHAGATARNKDIRAAVVTGTTEDFQLNKSAQKSTCTAHLRRHTEIYRRRHKSRTSQQNITLVPQTVTRMNKTSCC
jgi:hypothetical protein